MCGPPPPIIFQAERQYAELADKGDNPRYHLAHASCLYYLQRYNEAAEAAKKGPECELRNRLLFHLAHKTNDETSLMLHHQKLTASTLDQLSLAAIHYLRVRNHRPETPADKDGTPSPAYTQSSVVDSFRATFKKPQTFTSACCWRTETM